MLKQIGRISILLVVYAALLGVSLYTWKGVNNPPSVQAQSFEPFSRTFIIPFSASNQYIPSCTTGSTGCIPNFKQVAHTITESVSATPDTTCESLLDFTSDGTHYFTMAAGGATPTSTSVTYSANGYYQGYRIKVGPCSVAQTITYTGYSGAEPVNNITSAQTYYFTGAQAILSNPFTPPVIQSLNCTNTNNSLAFIQLLFTTTNSAPSLGSSADELDIPIAASASYSFPNTNFDFLSLSLNASATYFWMGAATALRGSTAVSDPVYCTIQWNTSGPYVPFNPPSL